MVTVLMRAGMMGRIVDPYKEVNHLRVLPPFDSKEILIGKTEQENY